MGINKENVLIFSVLLIIGHFLSSDAFGQPYPVIIHLNPDYKETSYTIHTNAQQQISLTTYQTKINRGILRLRSNADLSFDQQIEFISKILKTVLEKVDKGAIHTLFIGRLIHAFGKNNPHLSIRLALSASKSPLWDNTQGKAVSVHENTAVKTIANQAHIFAELASVFADHKLTINVSAVEKVLIGRPDETPIEQSLKDAGVEPMARLPFDCLTWFSVSKVRP